jgi:hypothetical protein
MGLPMENIQQSKSQLAKLLAVENITVQHQAGAKTAWFDVKNRVLCLPVWREMSNDLYDMLVVHEVGHALDTPADGWLDAIKDIAKRTNGSEAKIKGFLNVIEDARIDKRQKRRFPGAKRNYIAGYKDLIERDFFGTAHRDVNAMAFIDRLNIYFKGGAMLGIKFSAEELPMLKAVENAETFAEVIELTEQIYGWSKAKKQEEQEIGDMHNMSDEGDGDETENVSKASKSQDDTDDEAEMSESEADESEADDTDGSGEGDAQNDDDADGAGDGADMQDDDGDNVGDDTDDEPESLTEKAWDKKQEELVQDNDTDYIYLSVPTFDKSKFVDDYKKVLAEQKYFIHDDRMKYYNDFVSFKSSENNTISYMVKEFEMRKSADEYQRTSVAKTGVIDTNKLHSYKFNDDIFRRMATVAAGKNHGFVMFLDWSGSMHANLKNTIKQVLSLVWFCKRIQVPFEVYAFRTAQDREYNELEHAASKNAGELYVQPFKLRNFLSSRMKLQELNDAMLNLWMAGNHRVAGCDYLNSTPLNQAIMVAPDVINEFKARNKLQVVNTIFLTDGESDPVSGYAKPDGIHNDTKNKKFILQDKKTKKNYELALEYKHATYFGNVHRKKFTVTLLKMLKEQTGCNLIGFYIHGSNFRAAYNEFFGYSTTEQHKDEASKMWREDGFISVTSEGYDEYYILNTKNLNIVTEKLQIDNTMTKGKLAKEFMKFSTNKSVNRVLLQRFVKKIAA